jgi:dihydrodipicolinate synthase/N-acetylneuraminate lyase
LTRRSCELVGVLPALVTPFTAAGSVDDDLLGALVSDMIEAGVGGFVPCGSTGEFTTLTDSERKHVVEVVIAASDGRVPVCPHTAALSTAATIDFSVHAQEAGAGAVMVAPPFYDAPSRTELYAHYAAIAEATDIPIMLYNIPSATGTLFTPALIRELATIDGVSFMKDSTGDAVLLTELIQDPVPGVMVINGADTLTFCGLAAGATATVWGAANFIPRLATELFDALHVRRDLVEGRRLWAQIWPICQLLEAGSYVAAVKAGCELVGAPVGPPRAPVLPLPSAERSRLASLLTAAGVPVAEPVHS